MPSSNTKHSWNFFLAGGLKQVRLSTADDFRNLASLDQKLWVALSMPTRGLEFDNRTLDILDTDKDGRVRAPEVIAAVQEACALLKDPSVLTKSSPSLALADINDATPAGKAVLATARQILANLGRKDAAAITDADTADTALIFANTCYNGDGVIVAESVQDAEGKAAFADIVATHGSTPDRSGKPGLNADLVAAFYADLAAVDAWWRQGEASASALPLKDATPAAVAAIAAVRAKVDDFFSRCSLAAYDARATAHLNRAEAEYTAVAAKDLSSLGAEVAALPLAQIAPKAELPLSSGINPAWAGAIDALRTAVVEPVLGSGRSSLSASDWAAIKAKFSGYEGWLASKPATKVEGLGKERVRALLASKTRASLEAALAEDLKLKPEAEGIAAVDRLVRYHRDLYCLLKNFVNFSDFYDPKYPAVFQAGTLFLDGRSCDLCIEVADAGAHSGLGSLGKFYIAYCELSRPGGAKKTIAALFTQGDSDYLMVGRNGLFYDRKGQDWDARITKVIDNPISIRQAFWAPYKKFVRMIEEQIAKRASAAEGASEAKLAAAAAATANADKSATPAAAPKKFDLAVITGIGVAIGSIGGFMAAVFAEVLKLNWWQYPLVIVGLMLAISLPSMVLAWLKLRQRTLGPVLDANGWAINGRVKVTLPLGSSMTHMGKLPSGSYLDPLDPFAEKKSPWPRIAVLVVVALIAYVFAARSLDWPLPESLRKAPSVETPAAPAP